MGKEQNEQRRSKAVLFTKVLPMHAKFLYNNFLDFILCVSVFQTLKIGTYFVSLTCITKSWENESIPEVKFGGSSFKL